MLWVMVTRASVMVPVWLAGYQLLGAVYGLEVLGGAAPGVGSSPGSPPGWWPVPRSRCCGSPRLVGVVVCLGAVSMGLPLAAMSAAVPLLVLVATTVAAGTGEFSMTTWASLVQERIRVQKLCRTMSYSTLGQILPDPVGYLMAGPLPRHLGLRPTLASGAVVIAAAAVVLLAIGQIRRLSPADEVAPAVETAARQYARVTFTAPAKSPYRACSRLAMSAFVACGGRIG